MAAVTLTGTVTHADGSTQTVTVMVDVSAPVAPPVTPVPAPLPPGPVVGTTPHHPV